MSNPDSSTLMGWFQVAWTNIIAEHSPRAWLVAILAPDPPRWNIRLFPATAQSEPVRKRLDLAKAESEDTSSGGIPSQ
jgi:hypothetical protein